MEQIASQAGLTRKTLYNHFKSKEEIAWTLIAAVEAQDQGYRDRIAANQPAIGLLEHILRQSAQWCLANPALARLALSPAARPSLQPPTNRPSFQGLVRDVIVLGQGQGVIRRDDDPDFMTLVLLAVYGQAMLSILAGAPFHEADIARLVRIVCEGIGVRTA